MLDQQKRLVNQTRTRQSIVELISMIVGVAFLVLTFTVENSILRCIFVGLIGGTAITAVLASIEARLARDLYFELEKIERYNWNNGIQIIFSPEYLNFVDDTKYIKKILSSYLYEKN